MTAVDHYGSPYEAADMCLGSQLETAPVPDTPLLASNTDEEHDDRIPVYIEASPGCDCLDGAQAGSRCVCYRSESMSCACHASQRHSAGRDIILGGEVFAGAAAADQ